MSSSVAKRADAIRHITPHDGSSRSDVQCTAAMGAACSPRMMLSIAQAFSMHCLRAREGTLEVCTLGEDCTLKACLRRQPQTLVRLTTFQARPRSLTAAQTIDSAAGQLILTGLYRWLACSRNSNRRKI